MAFPLLPLFTVSHHFLSHQQKNAFWRFFLLRCVFEPRIVAPSEATGSATASQRKEQKMKRRKVQKMGMRALLAAFRRLPLERQKRVLACV
jgi:hypothetical protein